MNTGPVAIGSNKRPPAGGGTPTEGLTTRRDILLMANSNPTDGGKVVQIGSIERFQRDS